MSLTAIHLVVIVAAICGGQASYWFGLFFGEKFFKNDAKILKTGYLKSLKVFFFKWGGPAVALGRLIPLTRAFVPVAARINHYH